MDDRLRRSAAHVLVASLDAPVLDPGDLHHLSRVLRVRPGQAVTATDGAGRWRVLRWPELDPDGPIEAIPAPSPPLAVGFTPVKGERPEWVVQKLTELGVDRIMVLRAERGVVRWEADRRQRLERVAVEAAMQSRRCWLPSLSGPLTLAECPGAALAHFGGEPPSLESTTIFVGPEGGWSDAELALGLPTVSLGDTVLRAETAAVAAGVLLTALRRSP